MPRIIWGTSGSRIYETGVNSGVLFPPNNADGVPWNGLTSVNETPTGGDAQAFYQDGIKYFQISSAEEYKATINALSAPKEFALCDGIKNIYAGLAISQQPRKTFGFSYITIIGNDTAREDYGYNLHLVYNAIARPTNRTNASLSASTDTTDLSWEIETLPPNIVGFKPAAHIVLNSLTAPPEAMTAVENVVYGIDGGPAARQPTINELIIIFQNAASGGGVS